MGNEVINILKRNKGGGYIYLLRCRNVRIRVRFRTLNISSRRKILIVIYVLIEGAINCNIRTKRRPIVIYVLVRIGYSIPSPDKRITLNII